MSNENSTCPTNKKLQQPVKGRTIYMVIACYNIPIVNQPMYHSCCDTLCNRKHRKKAIRLNRTWIIFTKHSCSSVNNDLSIFVGTYLQVIMQNLSRQLNKYLSYLIGSWHQCNNNHNNRQEEHEPLKRTVLYGTKSNSTKCTKSQRVIVLNNKSNFNLKEK